MKAVRDKKDNPHDDPPALVTEKLCEAYRESIRAEIRGLKNTIIVGLSISTGIISLIVALIQLFA